jgi:hypothetical protein
MQAKFHKEAYLVEARCYKPEGHEFEMTVRLRRTLLPRNIIFLLLVLISVTRLSKPQGLERPEGLGKFKNSLHRVSNPRSSGL